MVGGRLGPLPAGLQQLGSCPFNHLPKALALHGVSLEERKVSPKQEQGCPRRRTEGEAERKTDRQSTRRPQEARTGQEACLIGRTQTTHSGEHGRLPGLTQAAHQTGASLPSPRDRQTAPPRDPAELGRQAGAQTATARKRHPSCSGLCKSPTSLSEAQASGGGTTHSPGTLAWAPAGDSAHGHSSQCPCEAAELPPERRRN